MSDSDSVDVGKFGGPPDEIDEGALLFRPSGAIPSDDDWVEPATRDEPRSRGPVIWGVGMAVVLIGVFGYTFLNGSEPEETTPIVAPILPELPPLPSRTAEIVPIPTDTVRGPIGSSVRVGVRATDETGGGMSDTIIVFVIEAGDGTLLTEEVRTSRDGIAVNFVRLPSQPSRTLVQASVAGADLTPARIVALAVPGPPERASIAAGSNQEAEVGRIVPNRLVVAIADSSGNPVPGALVSFTVRSGDGVTAPSQTRTDSLGQASALWRLGMIEGEQTLVAAVSGIAQPVTFRATAKPQATLEINNPTPTESSPVTVVRNSFVVGGSHVCSLRGGSLTCRGANDLGQSAPAGSLGFVALAAGASHTCALGANGVASCWGANDAGQLGDGSRNARSAPVRVRTELRFSALATGASHTCGLAGNGVPLCWGDNESGQLGDGTRNDQTAPRIVGGGLAFREIAAGWSHTCGLTASGNTFCWGLNNSGQLGDGSLLDRLVPTLARNGVSRLVAGSAHTCGISQGRVFCWGSNSAGQLGDGTIQDRTEPTEVQGLGGAPRDLAAGAVHTCALMSGGQAYCWGQNSQGQLGNGTTRSSPTPAPVAGDLRFSSIHAGGALTCGIATDGGQYCWGSNHVGQLGDGTRTSRSDPTRVGG
ncbi:MAG: Ig-like domain-containing protein [Gemmatimonadota bacterium]|nr:Ig-like domain-containing protein [Gemmatimonadota bacterium]